MKNLLSISVAFISLLVSDIAFGQWSSSVTGTSRELSSVYMVNEDLVIALSDEERILRSTDGGATFTQSFITVEELSDVQFVNDNVGYAVGENGRFLTTTDAGLSWSISSVGTTRNLTGLYFTDINNGYVIGRQGVIFKTTDGGNSWTAQSSGTTVVLEGVYFTDVNNGYIVGRNDTYLSTTDGGMNWTVSNLLGIGGHSLNDIFFTTNTDGFIASDDGRILRTTNGGASWSDSFIGVMRDLSAVHFTDALNGYVVGENGTIRKTTNGGASWVNVASGTSRELTDIHATNANNGVIVGYNGTALYKDIATCTAPVTGLNVSISVATNSVNFTWDAYPDAQDYLIEGGPVGGGLGSVVRSTNSLSLPGSSNFSPATTYNWRVTATCTDGSMAPPSAFDIFTTPSVRLGEAPTIATIGPNPATDFIQLTIPGVEDEISYVRLFDITGQLMLERKVVATTDLIDVSSIETGTYIVEIVTGADRMTSKIHIQ